MSKGKKESIYRASPPQDPSLKAIAVRELKVSFVTPALAWTRAVTLDLTFQISVDTIINSTRFRVRAMPQCTTGAWTVDESGDLVIQPSYLLSDPNKGLVGFSGTHVDVHLDALIPLVPGGLRFSLEQYFSERAENLRMGVKTLNTRAQTHFDAALTLAGLDPKFGPFGGEASQ